MKANKIEQSKQYEVTVGKNSTVVRVVEIERRVNGTLVFQCENVKTGKPMTIADADRFRKEIKASLLQTAVETIQAVLPKTKGKQKTDTPTEETETKTDKEKPKRVREPRADGTVSGIEAALIVLRESGEPMNIKQIMEQINERGLAKLNGKTPDATVSAAMQREIGLRGSESRFEKAGKGLFRAK